MVDSIASKIGGAKTTSKTTPTSIATAARGRTSAPQTSSLATIMANSAKLAVKPVAPVVDEAEEKRKTNRAIRKQLGLGDPDTILASVLG